MGQKDRNGNPWNRVDIEKVPWDERVGTGFLNLIIYQIDISQLCWLGMEKREKWFPMNLSKIAKTFKCSQQQQDIYLPDRDQNWVCFKFNS